jgi:hypothetical protein
MLWWKLVEFYNTTADIKKIKVYYSEHMLNDSLRIL